MTNFTADQLALQAHIEAQNAAFVARCESEGATAWCTTVSDPAHWASMDIFTVEQYERESLISYISDAHKDAYGFRPRGYYDYDSMTMSELEAVADQLSEAVTCAIEEEKAREARAVAEFEALIAETIELGANDRATAIRWICDGIDHGGDLGFVCYHYGLPYSMESELSMAA